MGVLYFVKLNPAAMLHVKTEKGKTSLPAVEVCDTQLRIQI